ncbi:TPA: carbon-nitrogen hydrolase family protein [Streptococcus suis]
MKIGLVAGLMSHGQIEVQLNRIEEYLKNNTACDLLVFGEAYLQGFYGLNWNFWDDCQLACSLDSQPIQTLRKLAKQYETALSVGFIELLGEHLYSSQIFIDHLGQILDCYRRISKGWKETDSENYREGKEFSALTYKNKRFATAICGDIWYDHLIDQLAQLDYDCVLWSVYINYSEDLWNKEGKQDYCEQTEKLNTPVFMVNSFDTLAGQTARGGAFQFSNGKIIKQLELGKNGVCIVDLPSF